MSARTAAQRKKQTEGTFAKTAYRASGNTVAKVDINEIDDAEDVVAFTPPTLLRKPKSLKVTVPATKGGADDSIMLRLVEADWEHSRVWITGVVKGGLSDAPLDEISLIAGCVRVGQIERLIDALQVLAAEADRLGLRTPRPIAKAKRSA